jgi:formamidopyrimidine-DNA glycosylase
MYGGICCFNDGEYDNKYYTIAKEKPSPITDDFTEKYFAKLISNQELSKLSVKAFLATEQRIPGLGNGVLQDILFNVKIHPKSKISKLSSDDTKNLFNSIKNTLIKMANENGRDTEKDLNGNNGNYVTQLSKNTYSKPCTICGSIIQKTSYLGGTIYYCSSCQEELK